MKVLTLFTLVIVSVYAIPVEENKVAQENVDIALRNSALEELVLGLLEDLRETILNGSDDIPVLDPLELENVHLDLDAMGIDDSYVAASNAILRHLGTFEIDHISITMTSVLLQRYSLEIDGKIPILELDAENYDLDVTALGVNVFGNGDVKIKAVQPRIVATVGLSARLIPPVGLTIISSDVVFKLQGFETQFSGLFGEDEFFNDFVNIFLRNFIPEAVEYFEAEISSVLNDLVMDVGNSILADLDLGSILG